MEADMSSGQGEAVSTTVVVDTASGDRLIVVVTSVSVSTRRQV
jgi:hypothetical protein